ncbi:alcohol dehydrogenase [Lasallia pustulata]|uniref:Alcohol dehydrogenase n=1 Tax=Lasallia pustulata TaxID=136370 RepID=A0A1W5CZQ6_9LECA|nr:alcohol dehydrogenase [Lasallia pustulata]
MAGILYTNYHLQGGTSGIGAATARGLAQRGAQIILLTHHAPGDPFLVDYIEDLRTSTNNQLIYAEQVDLSSLHSIRLFATKWVDNAPPRRLDMVIFCANTMTTKYGKKEATKDGLEANWGINYLANFHLLSILSPALRAQPPDRDVRIIFGTCASYIGGNLKSLKDSRSPLPPRYEYGTSKLALTVFAHAFQKHLDAYKRPDKQANNARVVVVDPSFSRTPGMRRWLTMGSLWGLALYLVMWPLWWLLLKSPEQGAQSFLRAAMEAELGRGVGGRLIKECREIDYIKKEVQDEKIAKELWQFSERQIEVLEKEGAVKRALDKKETEEAEKQGAGSDGKVDGMTAASGAGARAPGSRRTRKAG